MDINSRWISGFETFFQKTQLRQCLQALQLEAVVLPSKPVDQFNEHLRCLSRDIQAYLDSVDGDSSLQPNKEGSADEQAPGNADITAEPSSDSQKEKEEREKLVRQVVHNTMTKQEIDQSMDDFVSGQWKEINSINQDEFLKPADGRDTTCARIDAKESSHGVLIQLDVMRNQDGALERSTVPQGSNVRDDDPTPARSLPLAGLGERVENIRDHLNVRFVPESADIYRRVAALEDRIMLLERDFPAWSAENFNQPARKYTQPPPVTVYRLLPPPAANSNAAGNGTSAAAAAAAAAAVATELTSVPAPPPPAAPTASTSKQANGLAQPKFAPSADKAHQPTPKRRKTNAPLKTPVDQSGKPLFHACGRGVNSSLTRSVLAQLKSRQKAAPQTPASADSGASAAAPQSMRAQHPFKSDDSF